MNIVEFKGSLKTFSTKNKNSISFRTRIDKKGRILILQSKVVAARLSRGIKAETLIFLRRKPPLTFAFRLGDGSRGRIRALESDDRLRAHRRRSQRRLDPPPAPPAASIRSLRSFLPPCALVTCPRFSLLGLGGFRRDQSLGFGFLVDR